MNASCRLSDAAKDYLSEYYRILDEMIREMTSVELTDSISQNLIAQMIPHHQGAIEMSRNILRFTTDLELQEIANGIIEEQTKSIRDMRLIQCMCAETVSPRRDLALYRRRTGQIMDAMFGEMNRARATNRPDCDFLREMIPHHRGAVEMSHTALGYQLCSGLTPILEAIITSQERGICQMSRLLRCIECR